MAHLAHPHQAGPQHVIRRAPPWRNVKRPTSLRWSDGLVRSSVFGSLVRARRADHIKLVDDASAVVLPVKGSGNQRWFCMEAGGDACLVASRALALVKRPVRQLYGKLSLHAIVARGGARDHPSPQRHRDRQVASGNMRNGALAPYTFQGGKRDHIAVVK